MVTRPTSTPTTRPPLSRERVVLTAIELADQSGIESLTMRTLGRALGVEAMSLYNHVANKEDLLDGIADVIVSEIEVPSPGDEWKAAMRRRAISAREVLGRHPWATGLLESRTNPSPTRLRYPEAVIGCLREAAFSPGMALHAFTALDSYIYGFAIQEKSFPFETSEEIADVAAATVQALPADRYPYLHELVVDHVLKGYTFADEFGYGLELILDGLERGRGAA